MFTIIMPTEFKLGDTAPCRINGDDHRLHWVSSDALEILPADPGDTTTPPDRRTIMIQMTDPHAPGPTTFYCSSDPTSADVGDTVINIA
jgi:hypothetical protein